MQRYDLRDAHLVQAPTLVIHDLEIRIAERKAALAQRQHEKALWDGVDIAVLCIEFLSVFVALMFAVAGKPEAACAGLLLAIYLKIRR
jgi:hypothetical protein